MFYKSNFIQNIFTLSSGTFVSQLILFLATPFLSRLYTPENFGLLALYLSIVGIFWTISAGKYELAIVLPKKNKTAVELLFISIILNAISFLLLLILILFLIKICKFDLNVIYLFIPFGIIIESLISSFNQYNNRYKQYKYMSIIKVLRSIIVSLLQILFFYNGIINFGLVWGFIIGAFISLVFLVIPHYQLLLNAYKTTTRIDLISTSKDFIRFPKFQAISTFLNAISQNSILLLLSFFYGPIIVGYYSLAHRTLKMPIVLISESVRQVFYKEGTDLFNNQKKILKIFNKTTFMLLLISLPAILLVWQYLPYLFKIIFGDQWILTGQFSQILIFWFLFLFINPPTIATVQILSLQKEYMVYESLLLISRLIAIILGYYFYYDVFVSLKLFTLVSVIFNIILIIYIYIKLKK